MNAVWTIARLTWKRLFRGRTVWLVAVLFLAPIAIAAATRAASTSDPGEDWPDVCEIALRALVLLAPVLLLANAVGEENEGKTYTYLWSRPVPREAVIFGKLLAIVPILVAATMITLVGVFVITGGTDVASLARALGAAALGVMASSSAAVGVGALVPRHPLVVSLGYIFIAEQILWALRAVQNLSALYHVRNLAGLKRVGGDEEPLTAAIALAMLCVVWLAIAVWRVRRIEFGAPDS